MRNQAGEAFFEFFVFECYIRMCKKIVPEQQVTVNIHVTDLEAVQMVRRIHCVHRKVPAAGNSGLPHPM